MRLLLSRPADPMSRRVCRHAKRPRQLCQVRQRMPGGRAVHRRGLRILQRRRPNVMAASFAHGCPGRKQVIRGSPGCGSWSACDAGRWYAVTAVTGDTPVPPGNLRVIFRRDLSAWSSWPIADSSRPGCNGGLWGVIIDIPQATSGRDAVSLLQRSSRAGHETRHQVRRRRGAGLSGPRSRCRS